MVRRPYAPGIHGKNGGRGASEFGRQLAMKQKIKRIYGVLEKQFRKHFEEVRNKKGVAGDLLLIRLEKRFDNVVYRMGLASSRAQARQMITHGLFAINGVKMDIPSASVRIGDVISVRTEKTEKKHVLALRESMKSKKNFPVWVEVDGKKLSGMVKADPTRADIDANVDPQIVVEYYSK
jgi:small subunit ribosomal protein S4